MAERTVGRVVAAVDAPDAWYLKGGTTARALRATLTGRTVTGTRRIGKLLLLDTDGPTLGLRFGMTGRLLVDGTGPIERLEYSSGRDDPAWIRFALRFDGGGELRMVDPRRLGGVQLDPDTEQLGTDALAVRLPAFRAALATSRAPRQGVAARPEPHRRDRQPAGRRDPVARRASTPRDPAASLAPDEVTRLHRQVQRTVRLLTKRGGSHTGDLQVARVRGATCPRDGAPLERRTIGGRTTYSCPLHQR